MDAVPSAFLGFSFLLQLSLKRPTVLSSEYGFQATNLDAAQTTQTDG